MVLVKTLKFCERFVLCKIHPEKVFGDVLVSKQAFLDMGIQGDTRGYRGLQGVTEGYKGCHKLFST